ncbi:MAG: folate-binding protein YgfZ [Burkholderiaceae bacterium]|nr:folate-binding protein YgfZ [Burkholderiaceae bacterium]
MPEDPQSGAGGGAWSAPLEELQRVLHAPVVTQLDELGVLAVLGADAAGFLNSQLTVDVNAIDQVRWQLGAYCSVKGRVAALFEAWREKDGLRLLLPRELIEPLRSRLARFVLRAKVELRDVSAQWTVFGLTGPGMEELMQRATLECPEAPWTHAAQQDGARLARVPPSPHTGARLMLLAPAETADRWRSKLATAVAAGAGVWWWSKIDAGLPDVVAATQERFLPQMLNLDVLGGVHFRKGCYPGQEVVARSQYLGKLKRRMMRGHVAQASAGQDVSDGNVTGSAVGTVVIAATAPEGGVDVLFECPSELADGAPLKIGGGRIRVGELPYPMINPTA